MLLGSPVRMPGSLPFGPYHRFVREERHFCATLAHLLNQRGGNLRTFLGVLSEQLELLALPPFADPESAPVERAEIYVEFSYLRDQWDGLKVAGNRTLANENRRKFLIDLMSRSPELKRVVALEWPALPAAFNEQFMGEAGRRIRMDIASPHHWVVPALLAVASSVAAGNTQLLRDAFRALCKLKWCFSIKPDLVIVVPGLKPLCIEAKLLGRQGQYPSGGEDTTYFNELFQPPAHRVGQIELQDFLFRSLLGTEAQHVYISRASDAVTLPGDGKKQLKVPVLSWLQVFERLNTSGSLDSVDDFIHTNINLSAGLKSSGSNSGPHA
jgi:hypothetical protein